MENQKIYVIAFILIVGLLPIKVIAQCEGELVDAKTQVVNGDNQIKVDLKYNDLVKLELRSVSGSGKSIVESKSEIISGQGFVIFENVAGEGLYEVYVYFTSEQNDLCKERVKSFLTFNQP